MTAETADPAEQAKVTEQRPFSADSQALNRPGARLYEVAILTGGGDKPYVIGLTTALVEAGIFVEVVGSDALKVPELLQNSNVKFLNLRGDQGPEASGGAKALRVLRYYARLIGYAATGEPDVFHILWNNKFEIFDRTLLMLYYKLLGKRVILTAHNVNAAKRDRQRDSLRNRLSLKIQYRLCDHIFVHTEKMKNELRKAFGIAEEKVSVIPFGINRTSRETDLSSAEARSRIGIGADDRTLLFFGQIAPYKGLAYLITAFAELRNESDDYRLIIAGKPKWTGDYWAELKEMIAESGVGQGIVERIQHIPDEETEVYFKAADVLILPYTDIFQSGVIFLGYNFGLPAIVTNVGSLKDDIIEGRTGFVCKPRDPADLAAAIRRYFASPLFQDLDRQRPLIRQFANERYSWSKVAAITKAIYRGLAN